MLSGTHRHFYTPLQKGFRGLAQNQCGLVELKIAFYPTKVSIGHIRYSNLSTAGIVVSNHLNMRTEIRRTHLAQARMHVKYAHERVAFSRLVTMAQFICF